MAHVAEVIENRARLTDSLRQLGLSPLPSSSNFLLVQVKDATSLAKRMRQEGVAVRPFPQLTRLGDAIRISIGPWPMMEAVLAALRRTLR